MALNVITWQDSSLRQTYRLFFIFTQGSPLGSFSLWHLQFRHRTLYSCVLH